MTVFLDANSALALREAAQTLRDWQRDREGLSVALVYGPVSAEDRLYHSKCPVDQRSVTALSEALDDIGARWKVLNPCESDFIRELAGYEVALSNLHGPYGEDGRLQGLLDYLRVPYCGSGVAASAVAADKILCKRVMLSLGVPTPGWWVWSGGPMDWNGRAAMVKPPFGGSSIGMSLVREKADLPRALTDAAGEVGADVLVEDYLTGVPLTVGLLELPGGAVVMLPPLATEATEAEFYDADTKLDVDSRGTVAVQAAELLPEVLAKVTAYATTLWDRLGLRGSARVDFILTENGRRPYVLEVNSTPGMSRDSNFVVGAAMVGLTHTDVVVAMLHEALTRPPYDVPLPTPAFSSTTLTREAAVSP